MEIKNNQDINTISWLSTTSGGIILSFYEPESVLELKELCASFYAQGLDFDLIGHTSNILYTPGYVCERMVSTRKLSHFEIEEDGIYCECGAHVRRLSKSAVEQGIKGYEGLVDLPGTVAAAIYGNAGCYGCSVGELLIEATILTKDGKLQNVGRDWFAHAKRSSALKRGEKTAIILTAKLRRENGDKQQIWKRAQESHQKRYNTQPKPQNTLGSIFKESGRRTLLNMAITAVTKTYALSLVLTNKTPKEIADKRKRLTFTLLNAKDVEPYVHHWNCFWWRDEKAYELFWKYIQLHRLMFTKSEFEIEIKHNPNFKIP